MLFLNKEYYENKDFVVLCHFLPQTNLDEVIGNFIFYFYEMLKLLKCCI